MIGSTLDNAGIRSNRALFVDFFSEAYGERFVGPERFIDGYLDKADMAVTIGAVPNIGAAALLRNTRITACATSCDTEGYGSKFFQLVSLFGAIHHEEQDAWSSIGLSSPSIIGESAKAAGMHRAKDQDKLEQRLATFGDVDRYAIQETKDGLLIALKSSIKGPHYWQQVWDWS